MLDTLAIAATGLLAGVAHVASGPDHFVAVAPVALGGRRRALAVGLTWGTGHAAGVAIIVLIARALLAVTLQTTELLSRMAETGVGVSLVALGCWALFREDPSHGVVLPSAFGVGTLHGAAGSSHLIAILPATALALPAATSYLVGYALGGLGTMATFAALLSIPPVARHRRSLVRVSGCVALALGVAWLVPGAHG